MPTAEKKPKSGLGCFFALLVVFVLLIALAILSFSSTISGTEFSPNTFQTRSFTYSRIPGTRIRIAPTKLGTTTAAISIDILKHLPTSNRTPEWHVTKISSSSGEVHGADILVNALGQRTADGIDMWGTWSLAHPNAASVFWPMVQQVAFQQLYECIPELLQVAETVDDPIQLEKESLVAIERTVRERIQRSTEEAQTTDLLDWFSGLTVKDPENQQLLSKLNDDLRRVLSPPASATPRSR